MRKEQCLLKIEHVNADSHVFITEDYFVLTVFIKGAPVDDSTASVQFYNCTNTKRMITDTKRRANDTPRIPVHAT